MNSSARDQFASLGLASEDRIREIEEANRARERVWSHLNIHIQMNSKSLTLLNQLLFMESVNDFRKKALEVLLAYPVMIGEALKAAQIMKNEPGGKSLVWQMYQVRDVLEKIGDEEGRKVFLQEALGQKGLSYLNAMKALK